MRKQVSELQKTEMSANCHVFEYRDIENGTSSLASGQLSALK